MDREGTPEGAMRVGKILTTTDFSEASIAGVDTAARMARLTGAEIILLYVIEDRLPPLIDPETRKLVTEQHRRTALKHLEEFAEEHLKGLNRRFLVGVGPSHRVIADMADTEMVDLIVMGSQGHGMPALGGLDRLLLGSTTERTLRRATAPVMVVKPEHRHGSRNALTADSSSADAKGRGDDEE